MFVTYLYYLFWVLSRINIEIYSPLRWYEEGTVETWPKDLEKILYLRETKPGNSIQLLRQASDGQSFDFEGKNTSLGVTTFLGRVGYS